MTAWDWWTIAASMFLAAAFASGIVVVGAMVGAVRRRRRLEAARASVGASMARMVDTVRGR